MDNKKYFFLGDSFLGTKYGEEYTKGEFTLDIPEVPYFFKEKLNLKDEQIKIQYNPGESSHIFCNYILAYLNKLINNKKDTKNLFIVFSVPTPYRHRFTQITAWENFPLFNFTFRKLFDKSYKNNLIPNFDKTETEIIQDIYDRNLVDIDKMWCVEIICLIKTLEFFGVNFVFYIGRKQGSVNMKKYFTKDELKYFMWEDTNYNANEYLQSLNKDKTKYLDIHRPIGHMVEVPTFYKNEDYVNWQKNYIKKSTPLFHPNYNGYEVIANKLIERLQND